MQPVLVAGKLMIPVAPPSAATLKLHGITEADWWELWEGQERLCAICRKPPARSGKMHLDHDHLTGVLRGIVHPLCNGMLSRRYTLAWLKGAVNHLTDPFGPRILGDRANGSRIGSVRRKRRKA